MSFFLVVGLFEAFGQAERPTLKQAVNRLSEDFDRNITYIDDPIFEQSVYEPSSGSFQKRLDILLSQIGLTWKKLDDKGIMLIKLPENSPGKLVNYFQLRGKVVDNEGDPLPFTHVYLENTSYGTYADENGNFEIDGIPDNKSFALKASAVGFQPVLTMINGEEAEPLTIALKSQFVELKAIEVTTGSYVLNEERTTVEYSLSKRQIDYSPNLIQDVFRTISTVPSVSNSDYSVRPQIRGGNFTETAIYLDGFELINPFHVEISGGVQGLFNTDYVESLKILPGSFSTSYTDKLSGIVDMKTSNSLDEGEVSLSLDLLNAIASGKFNLGKKLKYFTSMRRGYWDLLLDLDALGASLAFYDSWNKLVYQANDKNVFELSLLYGKDKFSYANDNNNVEILNYNSEFDKFYSWLNWKTYLNPSLFGRTTVGFQHISRDADFFFESSQSTGNLDRINFGQFSFNQYFEHEINTSIHLSYGLEYRYFNNDTRYLETRFDIHRSTPENVQLINLDVNEALSGHLYGVYSELTYQLTNDLTFKSGLRVSGQSFIDELQVSPRANLSYQFSEKLKAGLGYGLFFQPDDYFDPRIDLGQQTLDDQSAKAAHYTANITFTSGNSVFRIDGFYKDYQRLRDDFRLDATSRIESFNTYEVPFGTVSGYATGIETSLNHQYGPHSVNVVYTYSNNQISDVNGNSTARAFDIPHQFSINNLMRFKGSITFSSSFIYRSGVPYTPINGTSGIIKANENDEVIFYELGGINTERHSAYTTLDLRFSKNWIGKKTRWELYFNFLNTLNASNTRNFFYRGRTDQNGNVSAQRDTNNYFPLFVTPGLKVTF